MASRSSTTNLPCASIDFDQADRSHWGRGGFDLALWCVTTEERGFKNVKLTLHNT